MSSGLSSLLAFCIYSFRESSSSHGPLCADPQPVSIWLPTSRLTTALGVQAPGSACSRAASGHRERFLQGSVPPAAASRSPGPRGWNCGSAELWAPGGAASGTARAVAALLGASPSLRVLTETTHIPMAHYLHKRSPGPGSPCPASQRLPAGRGAQKRGLCLGQSDLNASWH